MRLFNLFSRSKESAPRKLKPRAQPIYLCRELQKSVGLPFKTRRRIQELLDKEMNKK